MGSVVLGMPGPWADDNREAFDHYTTKIGGLPDLPPSIEELRPNILQCTECTKNLCLVAQVYAPITSGSLKIEERVIYVLGCLTPKCGSIPSSWRALRFQKVSLEEEEEEEEVKSTPQDIGVSAVSISKTNCSEDLDDDSDDEVDMEELGRAFTKAASLLSSSKKQKANTPHKVNNKHSTPKPKIQSSQHNTPVLPCFYVYAKEDASSSKDITTSICSNYSSLSIKEGLGSVDDQANDEKWDAECYEYNRALTVDRTFLKFKKRLDAYPQQCFRYSYGGKPLVAANDLEEPRSCKLCGGPRHFEMQLMPPLLYFLHGAAEDCQKDSIDNWNWVTLLVYTCAKSCSASEHKSGDWIIAEDIVLVQYEKASSMESQLDYFK